MTYLIRRKKWRWIKMPDGESVLFMWCPHCGGIGDLNSHDVSEDGLVSPGVVCPYNGVCGANIGLCVLEGWADREGMKKESKDSVLRRSLDDLLPEGATYDVGKDGTVTINLKAKRGQEDAAVEGLAKRLNIDPAAMKVAK